MRGTFQTQSITLRYTLDPSDKEVFTATSRGVADGVDKKLRAMPEVMRVDMDETMDAITVVLDFEKIRPASRDFVADVIDDTIGQARRGNISAG